MSAPVAYLGQPLVHHNSDAILIITTVMTVFAGFLVAIMAVLGDPAMIPKGSWRIAETRHMQLEDVVITHTYLFYLYLIAIGLMFVGVLIQNLPYCEGHEGLKRYVEMAYLFFGIFSFLLTLALPKTLAKIQLARSEAEIERRRTDEGIRPASDS